LYQKYIPLFSDSIQNDEKTFKKIFLKNLIEIIAFVVYLCYIALGKFLIV